jgi:hypothetical protein
MARIRSIKPEFPQSESMGNVSRDARLTFIQLWTISDDEGRLRGNSRMLASLLFPYDDDAPALIDGWLSELEAEGCIVRYKAGAQNYVQLCNWLIHQKIDKPSKSKIPPFTESSRIVANPLELSSEEGIKDQGEEGIKDSANAPAGAAVADPADPESPRAAALPPREEPSVSTDPAIALAGALRKIGVDATFTHPTVRDWAERKVSMEVMYAAVGLAREQKGPTAKIAPNYLIPIVDKLLNPPAAPAPAPGRPMQAMPPAPPRKPQGNEPKGTDESYDEWQTRVDAFERAQRGRAA